MRIGVLTYTVPHRKTYDTLCLLAVKGYRDVSVLAHPMTYKKTHAPLFQHRPDMNYLVPQTAECCKSFGYSYQEFDDYSDIEGLDVYLACGTGLIPDKFVASNRIINSHPGWIPEVRGLDALKWAILEDKLIGITTHFLCDEVDAGETIERRQIEMIKGESLFELGMRVYYNEIDMLVNALDKLDDKHDFLFPEDATIHRRMPRNIEQTMMHKYRKDNLVY